MAADRKTATVKKAAAKKAVARRAKPEPAEWSQPEGTVRPAPAPKPKTIEFLGRSMEVRPPTAEQLLVWSTILDEMKDGEATGLNMQQVIVMTADLILILDAVVVNEDDQIWLRRGRIKGTVTLENSSKIMVDTMKAYEDEMIAAAPPANRAARRAR